MKIDDSQLGDLGWLRYSTNPSNPKFKKDRKIKRVRLTNRIKRTQPKTACRGQHMKLDVPNQLNGFDLDTLLNKTSGFLTNLTGKATQPVGINPSAPPVLLQKPAAPTVTAPTPVATKTFMQTLTDGIQQAIPSLVNVANTAIAVKAQDKLAKLNVQRAAAGQPPIDIATYNEQNAPVIKIQGGVDSGTSKGLMYGGIAVGAALLMIAMRKRA